MRLQARELESQILAVLSKYGEMYGLQITNMIERDFEHPAPGFNMVYPALRRLERLGLVTTRWSEERLKERGGARRRYYRLTEK